ncbi:DUF975 family protein [Candidatus Saccharibacteria bacterium]|nr:DUF975 family protein [Candidatus Saccharibacteria bacterium]
MNRVELKTRAKEVIKGNVFSFFLIIFLPMLVFAITGATGWGSLVSVVLGGAVSYAMAVIFLKGIRKGGAPKIEDLLLGFKDNNFGRTLEAYIRYIVFIFLWTLLFIVPGFIKMLSYSQMFYILADNKGMSAGEAQKKSMEMMNGHKMDLFVLYLSFIPWLLFVMITFGFGIIYVGPYMELTLAAFHDKIAGKGAKAPEAKAVAAK